MNRYVIPFVPTITNTKCTPRHLTNIYQQIWGVEIGNSNMYECGLKESPIKWLFFVTNSIAFYVSETIQFGNQT